MIKGFFAGLVCAVAAGLGAVYLAASLGVIPANADAKPPFIERWLAKKALHAAIDRQMPKGGNPVPLTDANLTAGIGLYAANCAVCHGAADAEPSHIAAGLYQEAPQLAKHGVEDDEDGETYWKVYHGIRMTGMPAFRESLSEDDLWKLTLFLKHMDALPPGPRKIWEAVPSAGQPEQRRS